MPRFVNLPRMSQPTLFHPSHPRPSFQTLPHEIQERAITLVARLLRLHVDQVVASDQIREASDE